MHRTPLNAAIDDIVYVRHFNTPLASYNNDAEYKGVLIRLSTGQTMHCLIEDASEATADVVVLYPWMTMKEDNHKTYHALNNLHVTEVSLADEVDEVHTEGSMVLQNAVDSHSYVVVNLESSLGTIQIIAYHINLTHQEYVSLLSVYVGWTVEDGEDDVRFTEMI